MFTGNPPDEGIIQMMGMIPQMSPPSWTEEQDVVTLDLHLSVVSLLHASDPIPPCTQENPDKQHKQGAPCSWNSVSGTAWKEVWRRDCLEQAELPASSLVGLEKLQMVLHAGHKLCSCWPCLSAGFPHVLLLGPDGECRAWNLFNISLIFTRSSHALGNASAQFPAGLSFCTSVQ